MYYNLINLSQAWVSSGRIGMGGVLAAVHGSAFLLAIGLLWWRDNGTHVQWRKPRPAKREAHA